MKFLRSYGPKASQIEICAPPFRFGFGISGQINLHQRRTLLLLIFRHFKKFFRNINHAYFEHHDGNPYSWVAAEKRGVSLRQALSIHDIRGQLGFYIRMQRLKLGLSQKKLAQAIGVSRPHLSELEHGKHTPHPLTIHSLAHTLKVKPEIMEKILSGYSSEK